MHTQSENASRRAHKVRAQGVGRLADGSAASDKTGKGGDADGDGDGDGGMAKPFRGNESVEVGPPSNFVERPFKAITPYGGPSAIQVS
ncbi:uncharacterized protein Dana_GF27691 [Drosophila ananassae]|uniref:Uncharacterized protein n=1 Tax=Drosophila ananassae TaxID=7217 RepID=A0A0P8YEU4_DROAN|nr:uncharacterized protein Dana_GF27691 [Drosophila ananassae]